MRTHAYRNSPGDSGWVQENALRTGKSLAVALAVIELTALVLIGLSWASTYWSWDPQHYGDPPGPYLKVAAAVPVAALAATLVTGVRRVRTVAISQAVMVLVSCGIMLCAKAVGERTYETSYRNACHAGVLCDDSPRSTGAVSTPAAGPGWRRGVHTTTVSSAVSAVLVSA